MNKYKTFEELKEELGNNYDKIMYDMNLELIKQRDKAIEYIMTTPIPIELQKTINISGEYITQKRDLLEILQGKSDE